MTDEQWITKDRTGGYQAWDIDLNPCEGCDHAWNSIDNMAILRKTRPIPMSSSEFKNMKPGEVRRVNASELSFYNDRKI